MRRLSSSNCSSRATQHGGGIGLCVQSIKIAGFIAGCAVGPMVSSPGRLIAQEMVVPVTTQAALFSRILAFDRALAARNHGDLVIGILYQSRFRESLNTKDVLVDVEAEARPFLGVRYVPIEVGDGADLGTLLEANEIDVLYIAPLRAVDLADVTAVTRVRSILTFTGVPEYVAAGIAVGIGARGGRPHILINLSAARAEGADFSSELLKLAQIVDGS